MLLFGKTEKVKCYIQVQAEMAQYEGILYLIAHHPTGVVECEVTETMHCYLDVCSQYIIRGKDLFRERDAIQLLIGHWP